MKKIFFICVCNKKYLLLSNYEKDINVNICSNCHSYFTKKKKFNNSLKIDKFNKKYEMFFKK